MTEIAPAQVARILERQVGAVVPGLQYRVVGAEGGRFEYVGGWADVRGRRAMSADTTLMAYSMTKTFTAVAVLQLAEQGRLDLDERIDRRLPEIPYAGAPITVRHLLAHTAGLPNPIPLRWVHRIEEHARFDEGAALGRVLAAHPCLARPPGRRFAYSNLGYWLLGRLVERVAGQPYVEVVRRRVLEPLGLGAHEMAFTIPDPPRHANGYLARRSLMNLIKGLVLDRELWGETEGKWLRLENHYPDGPAFGGLIGTARAFGRFLEDQLRAESVLLGAETRRRFETPQRTSADEPIPMTLGWHVREVHGVRCLYKEGGGGGFHGEMRLYPALGLGTVAMANGTTFDTARLLNRVDPAFFDRG